MKAIKICSLLSVGKYLLMVLDFPGIFYTSAAAETEGREAIRVNASKPERYRLTASSDRKPKALIS